MASAAPQQLPHTPQSLADAEISHTAQVAAERAAANAPPTNAPPVNAARSKSPAARASPPLPPSSHSPHSSPSPSLQRVEPPALLYLLRSATPDGNVDEDLGAGSSALRTGDQSGLKSSPSRKTANVKRPSPARGPRDPPLQRPPQSKPRKTTVTTTLICPSSPNNSSQSDPIGKRRNGRESLESPVFFALDLLSPSKKTLKTYGVPPRPRATPGRKSGRYIRDISYFTPVAGQAPWAQASHIYPAWKYVRKLTDHDD